MAKNRPGRKPRTTFVWNPKATNPALAAPLRVLSARYPALRGKAGDTKLVFVEGGGAAECRVTQTGDTITITYNKVNMALRMVGAVMSGLLPEQADYCPFEMFGVMIDCSRNAVMTVDYMKTYLDRLAILGYNTVMLYTDRFSNEDTNARRSWVVLGDQIRDATNMMFRVISQHLHDEILVHRSAS